MESIFWSESLEEWAQGEVTLKNLCCCRLVGTKSEAILKAAGDALKWELPQASGPIVGRTIPPRSLRPKRVSLESSLDGITVRTLA
jgi:hypothetical protein